MSLYYQDEFVTLYFGNGLTEHQEWLSADVLVTDPPYGINHRSGGGPRGSATWRNRAIRGDDSTRDRDEALRLWGERPALVFGTWKMPRPTRTRAVLIWDKGAHRGMGDLRIPWKPNFEEIYVLGGGFVGKRDSGIISGFNSPPSQAAGRIHPHEKPTSLLVAMLAKSPQGTVADPFAGSGSTLCAAKLLGIPVIGVELEEHYCEQIALRLQKIESKLQP